MRTELRGAIAGAVIGTLLPLTPLAPFTANRKSEAYMASGAAAALSDYDSRRMVLFDPKDFAQVPWVTAEGRIEGVTRSAQQDWLVIEPSPLFLNQVSSITQQPIQSWTRLLIGFEQSDQMNAELKAYIQNNIGKQMSLPLPALWRPDEPETSEIPPFETSLQALQRLGITNTQRLVANISYYTHLFAISPDHLRIQ